MNYSLTKTRDVNKTFTRPRLVFQDQDQDFRNFPRPSRFRQAQDQDLHTVSDNLAKELQTMHLTEQSINVVKSTTAA